MYTAAELETAFGQLLRDLAVALDEAGVEWMIIGGFAVGAWAIPRGTKDVDITLNVSSAEQLRHLVSVSSLDADDAQLVNAAAGGVVRARRTVEGGPPLVVDLLCAGTEFEREALGRRKRAELFGSPTWLVSPDDLLLYKLIAGRPQDMADVDRLLRVRGMPDDLERVRRWADTWEVGDRLQRALDEANRS